MLNGDPYFFVSLETKTTIYVLFKRQLNSKYNSLSKSYKYILNLVYFTKEIKLNLLRVVGLTFKNYEKQNTFVVSCFLR